MTRAEYNRIPTDIAKNVLHAFEVTTVAIGTVAHILEARTSSFLSQ